MTASRWARHYLQGDLLHDDGGMASAELADGKAVMRVLPFNMVG